MLGVKFELKELLRREELTMIVGTGVDGGRFGGGGSERKIAFGTVGRGSGVLLMFERVKLTSLFKSKTVNETRREKVTTTVVTLIKSEGLFVFVGKGGGLEWLLTAWTVHRFKYIKN